MPASDPHKHPDPAPAYGPQGRWTQLRTERDEARAEVARLREALREIAKLPEPWKWSEDQRTWREIAREALEAGER